MLSSRWSCLILVLLFFGCARVSVQAPKEPIKVDVTMRLDIYQHIEKDIDSIEKIVSGQDNHTFLDCIVPSAYAQSEDLAPEVEQAALRRKQRKSQINLWQSKGVIGENRIGLLEIRKNQDVEPQVKELVKAENDDRMLIYNAIAQKNGTTPEQVQKIYVKKYLHPDAPQGTPLEVFNEATGSYEWRIK